MNIGVELELGSGAGAVLHELERLGGIDSTDVCKYHCGCGRCEPDRTTNDWTAQEDCSVEAGAEFITRILAYGTAEYDSALSVMGRAMFHGAPEPDRNSGNHIHVERAPLDEANEVTGEAWVNFWKIILRYQEYLDRTIGTGFGQNRTYNTPVQVPDVPVQRDGRTRWLSPEDSLALWWKEPKNLYPGKGYNVAVRDQTVEFRFWNAPRTEWRLRMHVGLSHAIVAAASDTSFTPPTGMDDPTPFATLIEPYADDLTNQYLTRQIAHMEAAA